MIGFAAHKGRVSVNAIFVDVGSTDFALATGFENTPNKAFAEFAILNFASSNFGKRMGFRFDARRGGRRGGRGARFALRLATRFLFIAFFQGVKTELSS